jgi:phenylpyruvate tautomerase PptA (4-oxalocrotonate tautomerase family)
MPLVRIDVQDDVPSQKLAEIANAVHDAIVEILGIPQRDRFQILNRVTTGQIIAQDAGLGFERSAGVVMIQIFTQRGRSDSTKQQLYKKISTGLGKIGVAEEDVFIGYVENGPQDWSFGFGRAQYLTGELNIPIA